MYREKAQCICFSQGFLFPVEKLTNAASSAKSYRMISWVSKRKITETLLKRKTKHQYLISIINFIAWINLSLYLIAISEEEVRRITDAINMKSRSVVHIGKTFLYEQIDLDISTAYSSGTKKMVDNLKMRDAQEGIRSFLKKKKPNWSHDYEKN